MPSSKKTYDVALSFAGKDREYVGQVAAFLRANECEVFYDEYETVTIWGKNLYNHLQELYSKKANYTVIFISRHYKKNLWTNLEMESAQARAFSEKREYILPARFDDTEIPGILSTIAYIDLTQITPEEFAQLILQKTGQTPPKKRKNSSLAKERLKTGGVNKKQSLFDKLATISQENISRLEIIKETLLAPSADNKHRSNWAARKIIFDSNQEFLTFSDGHRAHRMKTENLDYYNIFSTDNFDTYIDAMALSSNGSQIVIYTNKDVIYTYNIEKNAIEKTVLLPPKSTIEGVFFRKTPVLSPYGEMAATITGSGKTKIWSTMDGSLISELDGNGEVGISADCKYIAVEKPATLFHSGTLEIWSLNDNELRGSLSNLSSSIWSLAFSPDSRLIAIGSRNKMLNTWTVPNLDCVFSGEKINWKGAGIIFVSPKSDIIVTTNYFLLKPSEVCFWRISDGRFLGSIILPEAPQILPGIQANDVHGLAFSDDMKLLALGSDDGVFRLYGIPA